MGAVGLALLPGCHWNLYLRPDAAKLGPGQSVKLKLKLDGTGAGAVRGAPGEGPRFDVTLNLTNPACGQLVRNKLEQVEAWGPEVGVEFVANRVQERCATEIAASFVDQGHETETSAKIYVERY